MILKRLIEILKTFDKNELKRFERFVSSDYFNTNESVLLLLRSLKKFHPAFDNQALNSEYLFRKIYGTRKFNEKTFRYFLSELYSLAGKYISISTIEDDKDDLKMKFADGLITRRLFSQARSVISNIEKVIDSGFLMGDPYLHNKMSLSLLWHKYFYNSGSQNPDLEKSIEGGEYRICNTIIELSNIYLSIIAIKNTHNITYENNLVFAFLKSFDFKSMLAELDEMEKIYPAGTKDKSRLLNALRIYICFMITFVDEKDEVHFERMRKLVQKHGAKFRKEELRDIIVMLSSCCYIKRKAIDDKKYLRHTFELKKYALANDLYLTIEGQYMLYAAFFGILDTALALGELQWAEDFTRSYISQIPPEIRDDVYNYSIAEIKFRKREFEEALNALSKVTYNYSLIKLRLRRLMLMTFFELDHFDEAYSFIDSFWHFLNSNKTIIPQQRQSDQDFLTSIKDLLRLKENGAKAGINEKTKKNIIENKTLPHREWLLEKINEL